MTQSVCGYCGVGCRLEIEAAANKVLRIRGVADAAVNRGHLCVKGRYAHAFQHSPDRLTQPLKRVGDRFVPISWDEALAFAAERLSAIREQHGPNALGAFTSSRSTNEACYLLQKLFRAVLGTNNVDCCARVCHSSTALALQLVTGTGAASASYEDIERARCIVVAGANPTEAHPVVGARLKQAVLRGARLIVIDPAPHRARRIRGRSPASCVPEPTSPCSTALAKVLIEEGSDRRQLPERAHARGSRIARVPERLSLDSGLGVSGISVERMRDAAA